MEDCQKYLHMHRKCIFQNRSVLAEAPHFHIYPTKKLKESQVRFKTFFKTSSKGELEGSLTNYLSKFKKNCDRGGKKKFRKMSILPKLRGVFCILGSIAQHPPWVTSFVFAHTHTYAYVIDFCALFLKLSYLQ